MFFPKIFTTLSFLICFGAQAQSYFSPKAIFDAAKAQEGIDRTLAVEMYKKSAEGGYLPAQKLMAGMLNFGIGGVKKNCKQAIYWLELAREQDDLEALIDMASIYSEKDGECLSLNKSIILYKEAAEKGSAKAQYSLGLLNADGRGMPKNNIAAYAWFSTAMKAGYYQSSLQLRNLVQIQMTDMEIEEAKELSKSYIKKYVKDSAAL